MKAVRKSDFRVVVYPKTTAYGIPVADAEEVCEEIREQIKRHIDSVSMVEVESTKESVCSFCGATWTEASSVYNGGCCPKDIASGADEGKG